MDAAIRSRSLAISVFIHGAILLALIYFVMTTPIPPFPEAGGGGGVLVDIGYVDLSTGEIQPMSQTVTTEPVPEKTVSSPPVEQQEIATQEEEVTIAVNAIKKKEPPKKTVVTKNTPTPIAIKQRDKVVEKPRQSDPRSIYKGSATTAQSQGAGTTGSGDQGQRQGDPDGSYKGNSGSGYGPGSGTGTGGGDGDGTGPGRGSGISFDLNGRSLVRKPSIEDRSQETGKVVVDISVDRQGNVVDASPYGRGSTNVTAYLRNLAKDGAMKAKFSPNPNGPDVQKGTMTFVFQVQ